MNQYPKTHNQEEYVIVRDTFLSKYLKIHPVLHTGASLGIDHDDPTGIVAHCLATIVQEYRFGLFHEMKYITDHRLRYRKQWDKCKIYLTKPRSLKQLASLFANRIMNAFRNIVRSNGNLRPAI